jgi:hypothetical protein
LTNDSSDVSKIKRSNFLIVIAIIVIVGLGATYFFIETSDSSSTTNYESVGVVTVYGRASGIPCAALQLPCPIPTNQSSISANLTLFEGKYYFVSDISVNSVVYTVWFDNSTYYCIAPKFQAVNTCPP